MPEVRVGYLVVDATDPEAVAPFWCVMLGVDVHAWFAQDFLILTPAAGGLQVSFQRVPEAKTVKNRLHLDLFTDDLEAATQRALDAGGAWDGVDHDLEGYRWRTVTDPEGNEFDLIPPE